MQRALAYKAELLARNERKEAAKKKAEFELKAKRATRAKAMSKPKAAALTR